MAKAKETKKLWGCGPGPRPVATLMGRAVPVIYAYMSDWRSCCCCR